MGRHRKKKHRHQAEPTPQPMDMNAFANMNLASFFQILNSIDISQFTGLLSQLNIDPKDERNILKEGDPRIDLLNSLKPFLPTDKSNVVDDVIKFFSPKPDGEQASDPTNTNSYSASEQPKAEIETPAAENKE